MANGDSVNELVDEPPPVRLDRRALLRLGFFGSLAALGVAGAAAFLRFLYHGDTAPNDYVDVSRSKMPRNDDTPKDLFVIAPDGASAKLYLVNLGTDEALWRQSDHTPGGLIAFSRGCPHERCTIPWRPEPTWQGLDTSGTGAFKCSCCGAIFTKSGVKGFGPSPRSLDTFAIELRSTTLRIHARLRTRVSARLAARSGDVRFISDVAVRFWPSSESPTPS